MVREQIFLPSDVIKVLSDLAAESGVTKSVLIRQILMRYIKDNQLGTKS